MFLVKFWWDLLMMETPPNVVQGCLGVAIGEHATPCNSPTDGHVLGLSAEIADV